MKLLIAVTFEYQTRPPDTLKTTISASHVHTCVSRAVKEAKKALRPKNWSTMVAVVLERLDDSEESEAETDDLDATEVETDTASGL